MAAPMPVEVPAVAAPAVEAPPAPVALRDVAKALYVKRADIDKHGIWPGCKGRTSLMTGMHQQAHSIMCRARIQEELMKTAAGRQRVEEAKRRRSPEEASEPV
eukprot:931626-Pyramimonas_sp.AAC.1